MRALAVSIFASTALVSCATETTTIYTCAAAPTVAATYTADSALLRFGNGERIQLPSIPSEAGARYSDGTVSWYTSERDAVLLRNGTTVHCDSLA
ncbi:MAG: MliC family protein [Boseongicola sp.]